MTDAGYVLADGDPIIYLESLAGLMAGVDGDEVDAASLPAAALAAIREVELALARADIECRHHGRAVHAAVASEIEAQLFEDNPEVAAAILDWIDEG